MPEGTLAERHDMIETLPTDRGDQAIRISRTTAEDRFV